ncbi:hypothetical protein CHS0354_027336 [Potamilus streckersoni]|uniref:Microtubule-associated protein n=1 Tax=Potamilus streckersoni TaxID=2493646 RepID=A0AAE0SAY2_9BIVA|nr:hypothetical protein CHS0354_027336 [Potamilus streckersoni]
MANCPADQVQRLSLQGDYESLGIGNSNTSHNGGGYSDISAGLASNSLQAKTDPFQHGSSFIDGATSGGAGDFYNGFEQDSCSHGGTVQGGYTDLMPQSLCDDIDNIGGLKDTMQERNLLGNLDTGQGIVVKHVDGVVKHVDGVDNDYFMSAGQPLVDIIGQNQDFQLHPPISKQMDLMGDDSNIYSESLSNSRMVKEANFEPDITSKTIPLVEVMSSSLYGNDDFEGFSTTKENIDLMNQEFYEQEHLQATLSPGQSEDGSSWRPEMDPERSRRSTSPERELFDSGSMSLGLGQDMTGSLYSDQEYSGVFSPEMDQERSRSLSHERVIDSPMTDSEYKSGDVGQKEFQPQEMAPENQTTESSELHPETETHEEHSSLAVDEAKRPTTLQKDSKIPSPQRMFEAKSSVSKKLDADPSKSKDMSRSQLNSPQLRMGQIPRPKSSVATTSDVSLNKPEWNTYQREYGPATFPTRKKEKDIKTPTTPTRPSTAPPERKKKDASSDSGVEEDRLSRKSFEENKKKYGTDTKNKNYKPGGGNVRIFTSKVEVKNVESKIDTKPPKTSSPKKEPATPELSKSPTPTPSYKTVQSKVGSMNNLKHSPGGGNVKIASTKLNFSNVTSKVGSKDNLTHRPGGGEKKIVSTKVSWNADPKVGSMEKVQHTPGGGKVTIHSEKVQWNAAPKVGSLDNATYSPGGGNVKIESQKLGFKEAAQPKVGSMEKVGHRPGGGDKKIETQKLSFKENATARTDHKRKDSSSDK